MYRSGFADSIEYMYNSVVQREPSSVLIKQTFSLEWDPTSVVYCDIILLKYSNENREVSTESLTGTHKGLSLLDLHV